jgi:hypothetical protein
MTTVAKIAKEFACARAGEIAGERLSGNGGTRTNGINTRRRRWRRLRRFEAPCSLQCQDEQSVIAAAHEHPAQTERRRRGRPHADGLSLGILHTGRRDESETERERERSKHRVVCMYNV